MEPFTISRDERYHEAWPNICIAPNGDLVCSYAEADVHGGGAVPSAVVRISEDEGRTWSEPIVVDTLLNRPRDGFMMCRSVIRLQDGSLLLAVDWTRTDFTRPPGAAHNWSNDPANGACGEVRLYRSFDNGQTWTGPEKTGCLAVSLNIKQISDGTLFISAEHYHAEGEWWSQMLYRSTDNGKSWSEPITVLNDPRWDANEGDMVEMPGGELVMYLRENRSRTMIGMKAISYDGGATWEGPFAAGKWPINGRVSAGLLTSGDVLVMHRVGGFALQHQFGFFVESPETALAKLPYDHRAGLQPPAGLRWGIIDNDTSAHPDYGYGGWEELPSGDVYAVNYIVDDAPRNRPQIRGYRISRRELLDPIRDMDIDFEPPAFKRGKLNSQHGWVQQKPELWLTRGLAPGALGNLGNYVIVDHSGEHSHTGKASITGTRSEDGGEEVLRRDVGPYDLLQEDIHISLTHTGRQQFGIFRVLDASGRTIVELRSDFVHERLWAAYGSGYFNVSEVDCTQDWWRTKLSFTKDELKIFTHRADESNFGEPWCVIPLTDGGEYEITNEVNKDLVGTGKLDRIIASIVVVLGDKGALYFDGIEIRTTKADASRGGDFSAE